MEKTTQHILQCSSPDAMSHRTNSLYQYLGDLAMTHTYHRILHILEEKLSLARKFPSHLDECHVLLLLKAIRHQNLVGWHLFLKCYISSHWQTAHIKLQSENTNSTTPWINGVVKATMLMTGDIWKDRNRAIYAASKQEALAQKHVHHTGGGTECIPSPSTFTQQIPMSHTHST